MGGLGDILLRTENAVVLGAVYALITGLRKAFPRLDRSRAAVRLLPLAPLVLGVAALWVPGIPQAALQPGERLLLGLTLGGFVSAGYKVFAQTLRGRDPRLAGTVVTAAAITAPTVIPYPPPPASSAPRGGAGADPEELQS